MEANGRPDSIDLLAHSLVLCAVSGGGYIGGSYEMARPRGVFALDPLTIPRPLEEGTVEELYIRQRSAFLAPTFQERVNLVLHLGLGIAVNLAFVGLLLFVIVRPIGWFLAQGMADDFLYQNADGQRVRLAIPASLAYAILALLLVGVLLAAFALTNGVANWPPGRWMVGDTAEEDLTPRGLLQLLGETVGGIALAAAVVLVLIPAAVWFYFDLIPQAFGNTSGLVGFFTEDRPGGRLIGLFLAGGSLAFITVAAKSELKAVKTSWWVKLTALVAMPILLLWFVALVAKGGMEGGGGSGSEWAVWLTALSMLGLFWIGADQRSWSMYPYYRRRLERTFTVERKWAESDLHHVKYVDLLTESVAAILAGEGSRDPEHEANDLVASTGAEKLGPIAASGDSFNLEMAHVLSFLIDRLDDERSRFILRRALADTLNRACVSKEQRPTQAWTIPPVRPAPPSESENNVQYIDFCRPVAPADAYQAAEQEDESRSVSEIVSAFFDREDVLGRQALIGVGPRLEICAAVNISDAEATAPGLGAASFSFNYETIGSSHPSIGEIAMADYQKCLEGNPRRRDVSVPAAMAISGAAISPAMGKKSRRWLAAFLALANVRLGVWLPNPRWVAALYEDMEWREAACDDGVSPLWYEKPRVSYLLKEILGIHSALDRFVYVTDGGHYDNLGLVEALREGCNIVYVLDASGDEPGVFSTLGEAMALARAELGVQFDLPLEELRGDETEIAEAYEQKRLQLPWRKRTAEARGGVQMNRPFVWGTFRYPDDATGRSGIRGKICYIQTAVSDSAPWQVKAYWESDARFPNHSTIDQSFDHAEFEAYRALGSWAVSEARKAAPRVSSPEASASTRTTINR
jgi:hypothetical protein